MKFKLMGDFICFEIEDGEFLGITAIIAVTVIIVTVILNVNF